MDIANHITAELDKSKPEFISKIESLFEFTATATIILSKHFSARLTMLT